MSQVLVTGGAGYVGSHVARYLQEEARRDVIILDDLSFGHRAAAGRATFIEGDFGDASVLDGIFAGRSVDAVVHMAGSCLVGASMTDPAAYYANNVVKTLVLLDAMRKHDVKTFVFSSSAAVYGEPRDVPIREEHPCLPTNPYGETKLAIERVLQWYQRAYGLRHAALRYFNAAGAHESGEIGEDHGDRESHLIPRLLGSIVDGGAPTPILGEDYPTSDGTCVRDYVHVMDLAEAHALALGAIERGTLESGAFNLGNGEGFSVREVVAAVTRVAGAAPPTERAPRRAGDPAILVASAERAIRRLGWRAKRPSLDAIVKTAWTWHRAHPQGYGDKL
ncbi:MAG TPA: UDP-glucose 4-epimerase GalE [Candidatus Polarisedimenticolaceae bacterium]|nr:UDP-glucose 4-epimerase GalE [Candidatus Polarisedimenticolaceae bacterium]